MPVGTFTTAQLRLLLGDRIPVGEDDEGAFFSDEEIVGLLTMCGGDPYSAVSKGWASKAAEWADQIDHDESGSRKPLSQMFVHARQMAQYWSTVADAAAKEAATGYRVMGKAVDVWVRDDVLPLVSQFSDGFDVVQVYPLHRFLPAVSGQIGQ